MKNFIFLFVSVVAIGLGCTRDEGNLDSNIEQRSSGFCDPGNMDPSSWCDGGADTWPSNFSIQSEPQSGSSNCCITIDITSANANTQVQFNYSNHNFYNGTCSGSGGTIKVTTDANGIAEACWEPEGTHFLIDIPGIGCYVFENPDGNCDL